MNELLNHIRTPMKVDKRFIVVVLTILGLFALVACKREVPDGVLTLLGILVPGFIGVSQAGQTMRTKTVAEAMKADAPAPAPTP